MNKTKLLLGTAMTLLFAIGHAEAGTLYIANMNQANVLPPTGATFTGTGFVILNDTETSATVTATHNITIPMTGGHIHRGLATANGPVILPFPTLTSPIGPLVWAIPAADVTNLKNLGLYMALHTTANPGGAIRATLVRSLLSTAATNSAQMTVANNLDVAPGYNADLDQILMGQAVASGPTRTKALDDLSGRTIYVQGRETLEAMAGFEDSLLSHAEEVAGAPVLGFTGFVRGGTTFGKRNTEVDQAGSTVSRPFVMAGFDHGLGNV